MPLCRGTRIIQGDEAARFREVVDSFRTTCQYYSFEEIILPAIYNPSIWLERTGKEIEQQMWLFPDKGNPPRDTCLIPEATAIIQELYDNGWEQSRKKPICVFYETRCYRYERPQAGRYREFTQFGAEMLGPEPEFFEQSMRRLMVDCLKNTGLSIDYNWNVERGLSYYTRNGFEACVKSLGAQKQVAGGGVYKQGCGFAIGIDRIVNAMMGEMKMLSMELTNDQTL